MKKCKPASQEFTEIKKQLAEVQDDLKRYVERTNQQYVELLLATSRKDIIGALQAHIVEDIDEGLDAHMVKNCDMRETCRKKFDEVLTGNAGLLRLDVVNEEKISGNRSDLTRIRKSAPYKKCGICLTEASRLFEKEVNLMKSLQIYRSNEDRRTSVAGLPEEAFVNGVLDPLSNKARLQILKALYVETKTFSALSGLTGLRGGNLLFHLQKLLDTGMIIRKHEGGEYLLTEKGFTVLSKINEVHAALSTRPAPSTQV
ncbi:MAG TPA: winged helix-turn-helix domain-containing protein [Methanocella sp.]|nr:winged helix-turn-helix domain-containing protein [Methanocella sp.]